MEHKIKYKTGVYEPFNLHTHQHIHPPVHNANRGRQTGILSAAKILANFLSIAIFFLFIIQNGAKGLRTVCSVKISDGSQRWRPLHAEPLTSTQTFKPIIIIIIRYSTEVAVSRPALLGEWERRWTAISLA